MRRALNTRLSDESGMTLIEVLVAAAMSVVVVGGATSMLISAVRQQPEQSERAQSISTARYVLDRMTREIRNGVHVDSATATSVSFLARLRRTTCGGAAPTDPSTSAIPCQVTYTCTTGSCSRVEATPEVTTSPPGTKTTIVTDIDDAEVFCFVPSAETESTKCGPADPETPITYVGVNLHIPNPSGGGALTISDGASLRSATFAN
jgi:type II secretory pathway pseudopilin PulG